MSRGEGHLEIDHPRRPEAHRPRPAGGDEAGWILVLDIGSSSVRGWLYDREGSGLDPGPDAQRGYAWQTQPAGAMQCDADLLLAQVARTVDGALAHAREAGISIGAVAIAAFWHGVMGLGPDGMPSTPVYGWGDTRAARHAISLRAVVDEARLHARTGCFLHPSYPSVKLGWVRSLDPVAFDGVAAWVSFPEYMEERLFGERRCSISMASGSGLLDVHRLEWDAEALHTAGIRAEQLSPLVDAGASLRGLLPEFARRWPELATVPWFPALGDGACANVGSGAVGTDRIGLTIGTTAALRMLWEPNGPVEVPEDLWCYRLDGRRWVAGGALSNGGNTVAFLRQTLRLPEEREWEERIAQMPPDSHGLTVLPFLMGERGPGWLREVYSSVVGLVPSTRPEQIVRAWMEAVALRIGRMHRRLCDSLGGVGEVLASGGALYASPIWAQILADVLNQGVALTVEREATSRGAALVALERLGRIADLRDPPVEIAVRYPPDPDRHARYAAAAERQQSLLAALAPWIEAQRFEDDGRYGPDIKN